MTVSNTPTAASLLPPELLLLVLSLTRPKRTLPATCMRTVTAFRSAEPSRATRALLLDAWAAMAVSQGGGDDSHRLSAASHLPDRVCDELRALIEKAAAEAVYLSIDLAQSGPLELARAIAQGETEPGQALALLVEMDSEFAASILIQSQGRGG